MKNLKITLAALALTAIALGCNIGGGNTTISESDGNNYVKIEYSGRIGFSADSTTISKISAGGYVKYEKNDQTLFAKNGIEGQVIYQLNDGRPQTQLGAEDKRFLAGAVKDMIKRGHYKDGR